MNTSKQRVTSVLFLICLGILLNSLELITVKKVCEYSEYGPFFFGFPMIYRTNMTWVNSGSGNIFVLNYLVNIIFWLFLSIGLWSVIKKLFKIRKAFPEVLMLIVITITVVLQIIGTNALDLKYKVFHDVKMDYYQQEIDCKSEFIFFNLGIDNY